MGYCESCACEVEYVYDDYGMPVCIMCEDDVHLGMHLEGDEVYTEGDYSDWQAAQAPF